MTEREQLTPRDNQANPLVSLIIPTFNRPTALGNCLAAVAALRRTSFDLEVIVVDDGSPNPLDDVIEPWRKMLNIRLIRQQNQGPASARNHGAKVARGTMIAFTDDDCQPTPDWLAVLVDALQPDPTQMVGGRTVNRLCANPYATAAQLLISYLYTWELTQTASPRFFASNNMAMTATHFHAIGGFDTSYPRAAGEDRAFCDQWLAAGYRLHYCPTALLGHSHDLTLRTFWRQNFHYGQGAFQVRNQRASDGNRVLTFERLSFYLDLLRYPMRQREQQQSRYQTLLLTALFVLSQVANASGFFWELGRHQYGSRTHGIQTR